jgi:formate dehydrogenase subunit beta
MKTTTIKIENGDVSASVREFLTRLLASDYIEALLVPKELPGGTGFVQSLVKSPDMLEGVNPFAPTMAVQSAAILSELTSSATGRIAAVLKPCELRATIELAKFLQVDLEKVVTISVDCPGTYEVKSYAELSADGKKKAKESMVKDGPADGLRDACRICECPAPVNADITLAFIGCGSADEICVIAGEDIAAKLGLECNGEIPAGRSKAVETLVAQRKQEREKVLQELQGKTDSPDKLMALLETCIRCHNCMNVCPICYCKECVFESNMFEHKSERFLKWADRKGAIRMPSDTMIFHLTRMSHMATSCVNCGMCESACPNRIPVSTLFTSMGGDLQKMFEYVPGRDPEEEPPVSVFKEDELSETAKE